MTKERKQLIQYLLSQFVERKISEKAEQNLFLLLEEEKESEQLKEIIEELMMGEPRLETYRREEWQSAISQIINTGVKEKAKIAPVRKLRRVHWIAAAALIIVIATTAIVISNQWWRKAPVTIGEKSPSHDVPAPTNTRAVITLADGSKVYLDSVSNGTIAEQNNVNVVKGENGQIIYNREDAKTQGDASTPLSMTYNTLSNPRGSKVISLTLSDGTKVWLNSESSLKYPIAFNDKTREVEITGEAYFEVKHNAKQPFKVHLPNGGVVEDIGTSFNINSYTDEENIRTTLIEGSVRVVGGDANKQRSSVELKPGQQAAINTFNLQLLTFNSVDLDEVMAWKNGIFKFKDVTIEPLMKQIARWYDVDVTYEGNVSSHFIATIPRNISVANVFKILEQTGSVHFKIDGRKITVMP